MSVVTRIRRRLSPLHEVMPRRHFRQLQDKLPLTTGDVSLFGKDVTYSDAQGLLHSVDELFYQEVYKFNSAVENPHIIDAGANIGLSIIYFKRRFPSATVVGYEPDPVIFKLLQRNLIDYPGIDLRNAAAWTQDTELTFYSEGSLAGSVSTSHASIGKSVVKAERLADEIRKRPVDFLKIDIEGAENHVLLDIEPELAQVRALFFEYHSVSGEEQRLGDLLNLVSRAGFRYSIAEAVRSLHPFINRRTQGFDMQLNVSCFRP